MNGLIPTHLSAVQFFAASIATITNFMQELMLQLLIKHLASKIDLEVKIKTFEGMSQRVRTKNRDQDKKK